ncbi:MAG TPA: hypothetical protein VGQ26_01600 [Streptosporangiaceae bacterium]|nr:hypothetical protein [Streptosporangiaceae bacterium]
MAEQVAEKPGIHLLVEDVSQLPVAPGSIQPRMNIVRPHVTLGHAKLCAHGVTVSIDQFAERARDLERRIERQLVWMYPASTSRLISSESFTLAPTGTMRRMPIPGRNNATGRMRVSSA